MFATSATSTYSTAPTSSWPPNQTPTFSWPGQTITTTTTSNSTTTSSCLTATSVSVALVDKETTYVGETIKMAGDASIFGSWDTSNAYELSASNYTTSNPIWTATGLGFSAGA